MEAKKVRITKEGLKAYQEELSYLQKSKRSEIAEQLKVARAQGDLSENAEYDAAKEEQGTTEARIAWLENAIKNAEIVKNREIKIESVDTKILRTYHIVGPTEVDILQGKISDESPVGKALIGAKLDEIVTVKTEAGEFKYKVLEINDEE